MILYDFVCDNCGFEQERLVKTFGTANDSSLDIWCPKCDSLMQKVISAPSGFNLKGSGWYKPGLSNKK